MELRQEENGENSSAMGDNFVPLNSTTNGEITEKVEEKANMKIQQANCDENSYSEKSDSEIIEKENERKESESINGSTETLPFPTMVMETLLCHPVGQSQPGLFPLNRLAPITSNPQTWHNIPSGVTSSGQIELKSESDIESVLRTKESLPWTNVCLVEECSYTTFSNFPRFASLVGPHIRSIRLLKFYGSIPEISFISCCLSLKSVTIIQMDVKHSPRMLLPSEFPNLSKTFGGVKTLVVEAIHFDHPRQLEFFKNFLNRFPKLDQVTIPHPHGPVQAQWETMKVLQSRYLIKPVIDYLNQRHNNMCLPSNPMRRVINAAGVYSTVFPELAEACIKNGAFITNVRQKQVENLFLTQDSALGKIICLLESLNDRRLLARWVNLERVVLKSSLCDIRGEHKGSKLLPFPNLKTIHLTFDSDSKIDPGFGCLKRLVQLLLGISRGSVKELKLQWASFGHDTPSDVVSGLTIAMHLPGLTTLHLCGWRAWDDDLLAILKGLKGLKHLAIEDCSKFTEFGFIGRDYENPELLNLKGLQHLELINRHGSNSITDECFQKVFAKMKLTTFVFDVNPNLVTKAGYEHLSDGEFSNHIEIFPSPSSFSPDMSERELDNIRRRFKKFQKGT